jgi:hypothetical protein
MTDWAVIWLGDQLPSAAITYHVDWYDDRSDAIARRRELLDNGMARSAWLVHCPPAIVHIVGTP